MTRKTPQTDRYGSVVLHIGREMFLLSQWHEGELPECGFLLPGHHVGILCEPVGRTRNVQLSSSTLRALTIVFLAGTFGPSHSR